MYDYIIIGGGIIGASTAWQLKQRDPKRRILLLEKEAEFGQHQTGRNSGVIHAGVYYEPGSLKARFCREGLFATLDFCRENSIPFLQCGKLLVATSDIELERMQALLERCRRNGLSPEVLDSRQLARAEPAIRGSGALLVGETAITSYRGICLRMLERFRDLGGEVGSGATVQSITEEGSGVTVATADARHECRFLIACAGLHSDRLARLHGLKTDFEIIPFRGEYYRLPDSRRDLVRHLIYPIPDPALPFVGVHITRKIDGTVTLGPNAVLGWKREAYRWWDFTAGDVAEILRFPGFRRLVARHWRAGLEEHRHAWFKSEYLAQVHRFCPDIRKEELLPHPAGVRAQAVRADGTMIQDFLFLESPRSLHVCNAPSPAATSAIPIGRHICDRAGA